MTLSKEEYQQRQESKRDLFTERADKAEQRSNDLHQQSHDTVSMIPMGQPILVGHHSEKGHRARLDRSWNQLGKAVAEGEKAEYYRGKANNIGSNGIQSDDPEAGDKLQNKIDAAVKNQENMKAVNKAIRANNDQALADLGYDEAQIIELKKPDFCGRVGFPSYMLQNNNANIKRMKDRIKSVEATRKIEIDDQFSNGVTVSISDDDKIVIDFGFKPDEATRSILKSNAFKWSRYRSAWVRKLTANAAGAYDYHIKPILEGAKP